MPNLRHDATETCRQFEQVVKQLVELDAGAHMDDPDEPMGQFNNMLDEAVRKPVESDAQLAIIHAGVTYLRNAELVPLTNTLDEAIYGALDEAIAEVPTVLQGALLALLRHSLRGHRTGPLLA